MGKLILCKLILPEHLLRMSMNSVVLQCLFFSNMARICGNSQAEIAKDTAEYEMEVEKNIIAPFQTVVEARIK